MYLSGWHRTPQLKYHKTLEGAFPVLRSAVQCVTLCHTFLITMAANGKMRTTSAINQSHGREAEASIFSLQPLSVSLSLPFFPFLWAVALFWCQTVIIGLLATGGSITHRALTSCPLEGPCAEPADKSPWAGRPMHCLRDREGWLRGKYFHTLQRIGTEKMNYFNLVC